MAYIYCRQYTHLNLYAFIHSNDGMSSSQPFNKQYATFNFFCLLSLLIMLLKLPWPQISCILGRKSKQSVAVVDVNINAVIVRNANVTRSDIKFAKTTTIALVITTL